MSPTPAASNNLLKSGAHMRWLGGVRYLAYDDDEIHSFQSVTIAVDVVGGDLKSKATVHVCGDQRAARARQEGFAQGAANVQGIRAGGMTKKTNSSTKAHTRFITSGLLWTLQRMKCRRLR